MLAPGQTIDRFRIEAFVGEGGMGAVYKAFDTRLGRPVALKVLRDAHSQRIVEEARASASIRHPNVVTIYDVEWLEGCPTIVMEWVDGGSLRAAMSTVSAMPARLDWLRQIASGIAAVHATGRVHRDIKPENVLLGNDGVVKLTDFGIAKTDDAMATQTAENVVKGTPRYMSPEQRAGAPVDPRTDQYAWGLVAYELLTGTLPNTEPRAPLHSIVPIAPAFSAAVMRALAPAPNARFTSMNELLAALDAPIVRADTGATTAQQSPRARRSLRWLGFLLGAIAIGASSIVLAWFFLHERPAASSSTDAGTSAALLASSSAPATIVSAPSATSSATHAAEHSTQPSTTSSATSRAKHAPGKTCASRRTCGVMEVCANGECMPCLGAGEIGSDLGCVRACAETQDCPAPKQCLIVRASHGCTGDTEMCEGFAYGCAAPCSGQSCPVGTACHSISTPRGQVDACLPAAK